MSDNGTNDSRTADVAAFNLIGKHPFASQQATPDARRISGNWAQYGNGQTLGGAYRRPTIVNPAVAPLAIRFEGADTGFITLPGNRELAIRRFRF